ncbi:MAG TPA: hypothetical protein VJL58_08595 [Pyrinomonadaceae bacterium]|nr:hypothetical protein [Pyrinomonadaceae bacterium]
MPFFVDRSTAWIWAAVIVVVAAALIGFQFFRANTPEPQNTTAPAPVYTRGTVVEGMIEIPADQFLSYRLNFNKKTKILGTHWTGGSSKRVLALIITEAEFERWKAGVEFRSVTQTGYVPRGKIEMVIDPGVYYFVYDNRSKEYGGNQRIEVSVSAN